MDISGHFIRSFVRKERENWVSHQLFILQTSLCMCRVSQVIVLYETSGQFVTKFSRYGRKEGELRSPVSHLVLMVLYMYVTGVTAEITSILCNMSSQTVMDYKN